MFNLALDFLGLNQINQDQHEMPLTLPKKSRWVIYIFFLIANILINMDHGTIPASTNQLRAIASSNQAIGLFGSLVFVGNIIGSLIFFYIINRVNRKALLLMSLIILSICFLTFALYTRNILFLFINRIIVGIFQAYITIYLPVWCNQFGMSNKKSLMLTFGQLVVPLGVFFGYLLASLFIQKNRIDGWRQAFIIQSFSIIILFFVFIFVPEIYFSKKLQRRNEYNDQTYFTQGTIESLNLSSAPNTNDHLRERSSFKEMISTIFKKKVFVYSVIALSALFYIITGVQYWVSDYMNNVLNVYSNKERLLYFSFVCFTSPTIGVLLFGFILNSFGGYEKKSSILIPLFLSFCAVTFAFFVPLVNKISIFITLLWFALFFGGGILPGITGIIISSLPHSLAASGNSMSLLLGNLFGYLPSPYVYGLLADFFKDGGRKAMMFTMWYSLVGVLAMSIATIKRYEEGDENVKVEEKEFCDYKENIVVEDGNDEDMKERLLSPIEEHI